MVGLARENIVRRREREKTKVRLRLFYERERKERGKEREERKSGCFLTVGPLVGPVEKT